MADKEKTRQYHREYYKKNRERIKEQQKEWRRKNRSAWLAYKSSLSCIKCGISNPVVIDFHHVAPSPDDKKVNVLASTGQYKAAYKEAEERCIPICANCHRILHWEEHRNKHIDTNE